MIYVELQDVAEINPRLPIGGNLDETVSFLPMAAVSEGGYVEFEEERVLADVKKGFTYFERGDFIVAKITPCFENGKAALTCNLKHQIGFGSTEFHVVRPNAQKLDKNYLFHLLWNKQFRFYGEKEMRGAAGQKRISTDFLKKYRIPLPPLGEQKRIAAILDKADALRQKRERTIKLTDDLLRSVFHDMFGDAVTNPKGFPIKKLKDLARIQIGPFGTQLHKEDYIEDGIPLINPKHIIAGKIIPSSEISISDIKHKSLPEYHLEVGDIIMGRRGEMGRCALISQKEKGWMCGTGSLFIRTNMGAGFSEYLCKLLSSDAVKQYLERECLGATMPNLNKTIVGNISIPVPEQGIMDEYARKKAKIYEIAEKIKLSSNKELFSSLTQRAFNGELPQKDRAA